MASIRKHGTKWQARITRKGHAEIAKSFFSRNEAERWARRTEINIDQGTYVNTTEAQRTTCTELIERYRREVTPTKKGAKQEGYRLDVLKRSKLARLSLAAIRSTDIAKYRDDRIKTVAANTVKNELNTLSAIFEQARGDWGMLNSNPCQSVRRPVSPRGRSRRLTPEEESSILASCRASRAWYLYSAVMLAMETGIRLGELSKLRWDSIDLSKSVAVLLDTKNGEDRCIPLSTRAISSILELPKGFDGRLFPVQPGSINDSFRAAVKRVGVMDFHFHDLRHEAVSRLFERGLNVMEVACISGHKTISQLQRYTHLKPESLVMKLG